MYDVNVLSSVYHAQAIHSAVMAPVTCSPRSVSVSITVLLCRRTLDNDTKHSPMQSASSPSLDFQAAADPESTIPNTSARTTWPSWLAGSGALTELSVGDSISGQVLTVGQSRRRISPRATLCRHSPPLSRHSVDTSSQHGRRSRAPHDVTLVRAPAYSDAHISQIKNLKLFSSWQAVADQWTAGQLM